ncbi:MAG: hypothetical protein WCJ30_17175, partial [Deltaproteobacteria bacterium]
MPTPSSSLDALRYGLRALEEIARAQASVLAPAPIEGVAFEPHPVVRAPAREGAALSLRLFSETAEDASGFVLRTADSLTIAPLPARAAPFFEAHAAALPYGDDDDLVVGFPLVSFIQDARRRTAPLLFWTGARASWRADDVEWRLPTGARVGTPLPRPTSLVLHGAPAAADVPSHTLHAGLWRQLLNVDGPTLAALAHAGRSGVAALVRAAISMLTNGADEAPEETIDDAPLTRTDVRALSGAVRARAASRLSLQVYPHALVMLLPRGDPTSGLRAELRSLIADAPPARGPLAVFLGANPLPPSPAPLWTHGASVPTASQVRAATSLEGSRDLVALCGPPGCGKTALLHTLTAQTIVDRALGPTWVRPPSMVTPWGLVVTSTNNAAVDHALAPFIDARDLPVGLRLGNRRTLSEACATALRAALSALATDNGPTLAQARAAFEDLARPLRAHRRALEAVGPAKDRRGAASRRLRERGTELRKLLASPAIDVDASITIGQVRSAIEALRAHLSASTRVVPIHMTGNKASAKRARAAWAKANARRGPVIRPLLDKLARPVPFRDLGEHDDVAEALSQQHDEMTLALASLEAIVHGLARPEWQRDLEAITRALAQAERDDHANEPTAPPLDPSLVGAALAVRDAWARSHRATLEPRLAEALALVLEEKRHERGRGLPGVLASVASIFPVAGCTLLSLRASFDLEAGVIDRLVVDEAGQCAPIYTVAALARASRALVMG